MQSSLPTLPQLLTPLNEALSPMLKRGFANPMPLTGGIVLLEVIGRTSGIPRSVPLVCSDYGVVLAVSTVRKNSQWVKNLAANPRTTVWLRGRKRHALAGVFQGGKRIDASSLPDDPGSHVARAFSAATGASVALLHLQ
ncbi:MAG: nitroreductase/quinone reductase family protein [Pseudomonadales bacterium]